MSDTTEDKREIESQGSQGSQGSQETRTEPQRAEREGGATTDKRTEGSGPRTEGGSSAQSSSSSPHRDRPPDRRGYGGGGRPGPRRPGGGRGRPGGRYKVYFRKKVCKFCVRRAKINFLDPDALRRFTTDRGKILPRRITGNCAKHQRQLALAVKRARALALLPFVSK